MHQLHLALFIYTQEEDRIIRKEAVVLKERVGARDTTPVSFSLSLSLRLTLSLFLSLSHSLSLSLSPSLSLSLLSSHSLSLSFSLPLQRQMREYLIRLIYCEMLGLECSWGYIHAVKFTQNTTTLDKRIGQCCPHTAFGGWASI